MSPTPTRPVRSAPAAMLLALLLLAAAMLMAQQIAAKGPPQATRFATFNASLNRNVTTEFSNLIKRMLAKDRAERPQTITDFLRDMMNIRVLKVLPKAAAGKASSE